MFIARLVKRYKDDIFWDDPTRNLEAEEPGTAAVQELFPKMPRLLPYPKTQIYIKSEDGCLRPIKQEGKKDKRIKRREGEKRPESSPSASSSPPSPPSTSTSPTSTSSSPTSTSSTSFTDTEESKGNSTATKRPAGAQGDDKIQPAAKTATVEKVDDTWNSGGSIVAQATDKVQPAQANDKMQPNEKRTKVVYECNYCSVKGKTTKYTATQNLVIHVRKEHKDVKEKCDSCQFQGIPYDVQIHRYQEHLVNATKVGKSLFACDFCGDRNTRFRIR